MNQRLQPQTRNALNKYCVSKSRELQTQARILTDHELEASH